MAAKPQPLVQKQASVADASAASVRERRVLRRVKTFSENQAYTIADIAMLEEEQKQMGRVISKSATPVALIFSGLVLASGFALTAVGSSTLIGSALFIGTVVLLAGGMIGVIEASCGSTKNIAGLVRKILPKKYVAAIDRREIIREILSTLYQKRNEREQLQIQLKLEAAEQRENDINQSLEHVAAELEAMRDYADPAVHRAAAEKVLAEVRAIQKNRSAANFTPEQG